LFHFISNNHKVNIANCLILEANVVEGLQNEDSVGSVTSVDLGQCEEVMKVALVMSVLQDQLAKHEALMRSWAGDVRDLWETLYGSIPALHPWFQLVNNLPLPPVVGNPKPEDTHNSSINEDEEPESDVEGEEVDPELMENLLNFAINGEGNPDGRVGNGDNNLDV
jgi:hypothetical protein